MTDTVETTTADVIEKAHYKALHLGKTGNRDVDAVLSFANDIVHRINVRKERSKVRQEAQQVEKEAKDAVEEAIDGLWAYVNDDSPLFDEAKPKAKPAETGDDQQQDEPEGEAQDESPLNIALSDFADAGVVKAVRAAIGLPQRGPNAKVTVAKIDDWMFPNENPQPIIEALGGLSAYDDLLDAIAASIAARDGGVPVWAYSSGALDDADRVSIDDDALTVEGQANHLRRRLGLPMTGPRSAITLGALLRYVASEGWDIAENKFERESLAGAALEACHDNGIHPADWMLAWASQDDPAADKQADSTAETAA